MVDGGDKGVGGLDIFIYLFYYLPPFSNSYVMGQSFIVSTRF